ncbi:hypothetical protein [Duganella vulcania]|uniref:Uncharacterized protein n=1 Tax=Duganella vulcania TaxID=2692166 RepID=A0A845GIR3_9BURK|nr:hypothetical protein [Duganella vulcania]MYM92647.1 hypothetical protein [Duganella vulcania]
MHNEKLTVQSTDINSSQEWASDPNMIEVYITQSFLDKAEKCVGFMKENGVDKVTIWWAFGYELFENVNGVDEGDLKGQEIVKGENDEEYVTFDPEYCLEGCHAEIYQDGDIKALFPFKHTSESLWCGIGALNDLKARMATRLVEEA